MKGGSLTRYDPYKGMGTGSGNPTQTGGIGIKGRDVDVVLNKLKRKGRITGINPKRRTRIFKDIFQ